MAVVVSGGEPVSVTSYTGFNAAPRVAGSLAFYTGARQSYAELYRSQPNVRLVVRFLGRNVAQLGLKAFHKLSDTDRTSFAATDPLSTWLKQPDSLAKVPVTRHRFIRAIVEDLAIYDVHLSLKLRNSSNGKLSTVRIPPTHFIPMGESILWPDFFRVWGPGGFKDYFPPDVIYLSGYNPIDGRIGMSPLEALRRVLAEEFAAGEWREQYWQGAARVPGYLERPVEAPKWSPEARDRFSEDFAASYSGAGPGAGRTPILEEGMTFNGNAAFSPKDSEYLGARLLSRAEVASQYFVHPAFVGVTDAVTFASIQEIHRSLYADTLGPILDQITEELEAQLLPEFPGTEDAYFEFNIAAKLAGSFEEQATALSSLVGAPTFTRNEGRAKMNLPRIEGGDELVTPLNVLIGGQASPRDSAPPLTPAPGTLSRVMPSKAGRHRHGKTALTPALRGWEAKHVEVVSGFFTRQRDSVISKLGAGHELATAFDADRWNTELRNDLFGLALSESAELGGQVAENAGATFDSTRVEAWLGENARIAAERINSTTLAQLGTAVSGVPRTSTASRPTSAKADVHRALVDAGIVDEGDDGGEEDLPEDPLSPDATLSPVRDVFDLAIGARAAQIATSRTTAVGQFSRSEGAAQAGLRTKTWIGSGLPNSRHSGVDGETVPIGQTFSNGGQWPGDPALGEDQTAGCQCSLDFGQ